MPPPIDPREPSPFSQPSLTPIQLLYFRDNLNRYGAVPSGVPTWQFDTDGTLNTSLLAYYKLEDNTDALGVKNLTEAGSPTYVSGKVNNGLQQGSNNSTIYLSRLENYGVIGGAISFSFWFNPNTFPVGDGVMVNLQDATNNVDYLISIDTSGGRIRWTRGRIGVANQQVTYTYTFVAGTSYNFIGTYDGATLKLFVDGTQQGGDIGAGGTDGSGGVNRFAIGATISGTAFASGVIDELGVWSKALSTQEIADLYQGGLGQTIV